MMPDGELKKIPFFKLINTKIVIAIFKYLKHIFIVIVEICNFNKMNLQNSSPTYFVISRYISESDCWTWKQLR